MNCTVHAWDTEARAVLLDQSEKKYNTVLF